MFMFIKALYLKIVEWSIYFIFWLMYQEVEFQHFHTNGGGGVLLDPKLMIYDTSQRTQQSF